MLKCFEALMKGTQEGGLRTTGSLNLITVYLELRDHKEVKCFWLRTGITA